MTNTPQRDKDASQSESSEAEDVLDSADDDGWQDIEPDVEVIEITCLMCDIMFEGVESMLQHCKDIHELDFVQVHSDLRLDFLSTVKLVNYIRSKTKAAVKALDLSERTVFEDEKYLQPVLEDDALLYSLQDALDFEDDSNDIPIIEKDSFANDTGTRYVESESASQLKVEDIIKELELCNQEIKSLRLRLKAQEESTASIKQFTDDLGSPLNDGDAIGSHENQKKQNTTSDTVDSSYFASYSGHGILSMFCARAGAAQVVAVDNSEIINSARENVYKNGMGDKITCLRGKIEEVILPIQKVDIIVSEWMGYCLLYEAMLDSVIWARDRYLKADGLMVPSHCILRIAPMSDPEYIDEHVSHWKNVYGFDMSSMCHNIYDDAMVQKVPKNAIAGESSPFLTLPLKSITAEQLSFVAEPFEFQVRDDLESLDGFVIWFDTFFFNSPTSEVSAHLKAEDCDQHLIAFTTGPFGKDTHWHQAVLLINHHDKQPKPLQKGEIISGTIGYQKRKSDSRALDISVSWGLERKGMNRKQSWSMR
ncbi:hypothetical protein P7C71_g1240, partial [Lecanoromycetidae sp. Uapishka_2]